MLQESLLGIFHQMPKLTAANVTASDQKQQYNLRNQTHPSSSSWALLYEFSPSLFAFFPFLIRYHLTYFYAWPGV